MGPANGAARLPPAGVAHLEEGERRKAKGEREKDCLKAKGERGKAKASRLCGSQNQVQIVIPVKTGIQAGSRFPPPWE